MKRAPVLIGNGQGFWGDSNSGPLRLVTEGPLHYLTLDYLAEVTMSILQKAKSRDPQAGYATDFIRVLERVLPICREKGIKIIANAGGVNLPACFDAASAVIHKLGLNGVRVGIVEGDDLLPRLGELGEQFINLDTGAALGDDIAKVQSVNAYLGAQPIVEALAAGADVVITGRCTDASMVVAPFVHEFGWSMTDYDRLCAATIAGHIIECGTQCTGGNFEGWRHVPSLRNIGYPVCEAREDGSFVITKHPGTGGLVSCDTVTAQILYEIGDPANYLTADVNVDFTSIELDDDGPDRVLVTGAKGKAPTDTYKVSMTVAAGYRLVGQLTVAGPEAEARARLTADLLFDRLAADGLDFPDRLVECIGVGVLDGRRYEPSEVLLRVAVRDADRRKLDRLGGELAPMLLAGPPGLTGFAGGRPKASDISAHWPTLVPKHKVPYTVSVSEVA